MLSSVTSMFRNVLTTILEHIFTMVNIVKGTRVNVFCPQNLNLKKIEYC